MKRHAVLAGLLLAYAASTDAAPPPTTQAEGFNEGKAYKPANAGIQAGIHDGALANVPGQDVTTTAKLQELYGTSLDAPGKSKVDGCAAYVPGTDAYRNQECDTINYVAGNPSTRPRYTVDRIDDPLVILSNNVRNTAESHTAGTTGLAGTYSACIDQTTHVPERFDIERCLVGRPVTEAQCSSVLSVTYRWQRYAAQPGADLRYGRCNAGQARGDQLTIPFTNAYSTQPAACADNGHGMGIQTLIWYTDCTGTRTLHGYHASACSIPPTPAVSDPPRRSIASCTNAPRNNENCFTLTGQYTDKAELPVFQDAWDRSACAELDAHSVVLKN